MKNKAEMIVLNRITIFTIIAWQDNLSNPEISKVIALSSCVQWCIEACNNNNFFLAQMHFHGMVHHWDICQY